MKFTIQAKNTIVYEFTLEFPTIAAAKAAIRIMNRDEAFADNCLLRDMAYDGNIIGNSMRAKIS